MNILKSIMAERRADVEAARRRVSLGALRKLAQNRTHHSLTERLAETSATRVIAEMKKASPSAGLLRKDYRPADIARTYEKAGATGISVLTEPHHFLGGEQHLREVRQAVDLPVLRKDFMCDVYQVYEAAAWGADVILLIAAALESDHLRLLYEEAMWCGLDVIVEAHTVQEVEAALALEKAIVGINNRNLKTLKTDLSNTRQLSGSIPRDRLSIAESGIRTRAHITELEKLGYNGFLIGEVMMRAKDPGTKLMELTGSGSTLKKQILQRGSVLW